MPDRADTEPIDPVASDPEAAGISGEKDDPGGHDAAVPEAPEAAEALDDEEEHAARPVLLAGGSGRRARGSRGSGAHD